MTRELTGRRIVLLTLQHFAHAPRAQKEAAALAAAGARVTVLGSWWDRTKAAEDERLAASMGVSFVPLVTLFQGGHTWLRLRARAARELYRRTGLVWPESFGSTARLLLRAARDLQPDLVMIHCEPGLWAGRELHRAGFRVGIDFEDWYSEDLLPEARADRPVKALAEAERYLLRHAVVRFAPTQAMAAALTEAAGLPSTHQPVRVPNCFPWAEAPPAAGSPGDNRNLDSLSLYWFSQTIGPGRGLELLARALPRLRGSWELHLRGDIRAHQRWFESTFPAALRDRIRLHETVSNDQLPVCSASHDLGLALEIPFCPSRDLTATNKIFEYLRCGLAVVATATAGQREVMAACPAAGWLVPPDDDNALAGVLQACIDQRDRLRTAREAARQAARDTWAWERFQPDLVRTIARAMAPG